MLTQLENIQMLNLTWKHNRRVKGMSGDCHFFFSCLVVYFFFSWLYLKTKVQLFMSDFVKH